jgi:hypothetical protein
VLGLAKELAVERRLDRGRSSEKPLSRVINFDVWDGLRIFDFRDRHELSFPRNRFAVSPPQRVLLASRRRLVGNLRRNDAAADPKEFSAILADARGVGMALRIRGSALFGGVSHHVHSIGFGCGSTANGPRWWVCWRSLYRPLRLLLTRPPRFCAPMSSGPPAKGATPLIPIGVPLL